MNINVSPGETDFLPYHIANIPEISPVIYSAPTVHTVALAPNF
ncbi:MAG: hypothetical protein ACTSQ6_06015 [Candidatus Heimdallarchaeaceae archaeon]